MLRYIQKADVGKQWKTKLYKYKKWAVIEILAAH